MLVEDAATKLWMGLTESDRAGCFELAKVLVLGEGVPRFVKQKSAMALVAVGKAGWPRECPAFLDTVLVWIGARPTCVSGLDVLRVTAEEFASDRAKLTVERKAELSAALGAQMPSIFAALFGVLEGVARAHLPFAAPYEGRFVPSLMNQNAEDACMAVAALEGLAQLVACLPPKDHVPATLYELLFMFTWETGPVGVAALACLGEILSRHCFPRDFAHFILRVFNHQLVLLKSLADAKAVENLDEAYSQKLTYFIEIFVGQHFRRVMQNPEARVDEFLSLFFSFTFGHTRPEAFLECVDVWDAFLEDAVERLRESEQPAVQEAMRALLSKYGPGLVALFDALLLRSRFTTNPVLAELDDEDRDQETGLTEQSAYTSKCVTVMEKVTECFLEECVGRISLDFAAVMAQFRAAAGAILAGGALPEQALNVLRDVPAALRLLGQLGPKFCDRFETFLPTGFSLLGAVLEAVEFTESHLLAPGALPERSKARTLVGGVAKAGVSVLHAFGRLLSMSSQQHAAGHALLVAQLPPLISQIVRVIAKLLQPTVPGDVALTAATLLSSLVSSVRPAFLVSLPEMRDLIMNAEALARGQNDDVAYALFQGVVAALVIYATVHKAPESAGAVAGFLASPLAEYRALVAAPRPNASPLIARSVRILHAAISSVRSEKVAAKTLVYEAVGDAIQGTLPLVAGYISDVAVVSEVTGLFLILIETMPSLAGPALIEQALTVLLSGFRANLRTVLSEATPANQRLVARALELLSTVSRDHNARGLVAPIASLAVEVVHPESRGSAMREEVAPLISDLLFNLMDTHWKVLAAGNDPATSALHARMVVLLCSTLAEHTEPSLCRTSLSALAELNGHHHLFRSEAFQACAHAFLATLLTALVDGSHGTLKEEIADTLFAVAENNLGHFCSDFLPAFLAQITDPAEAAQIAARFSRENDLPTFAASLDKMVADIRFVKSLKPKW